MPLTITTTSLTPAVAGIESTQQLEDAGGVGSRTWRLWPYLDVTPGPAGFSGGLGDWNSQSNGGLAVTAGVSTQEVLGINTTAATDHTSLAALLEAEIAAVIPGVTVRWTGTHIRISAAPGSDPILAIGTPADPDDYDADLAGANYLAAAGAVVVQAPAGVTLSTAGLLTRDVADAGQYPLRIHLVDAADDVDAAEFTLTVRPADSIVERIALAIKAALDALVGDAVLSAAVRPPKLDGYTLRHGLAVLQQQDAAEAPDLDIHGNPPARAWRQPFSVDLFVLVDDSSTAPIETTLNSLEAAVTAALMADATWGGLAISTERRAAQSFVLASGGVEGRRLTFEVLYRTPENDPWNVR